MTLICVAVYLKMLALSGRLLTVAHVGFLHDPDVRATLVTWLYNADLIVDKTMIQEALRLIKHTTLVRF